MMHGNGPWGMMGWGGGMAPYGMIVWILILALLVAGVVWMIRAMTSSSGDLVGRRSSALDVLEERYARGEIKRDEYLEKRRDLAA